jgi:ubiquinone/menaquinone biosynthesis C-methylase UbiE
VFIVEVITEIELQRRYYQENAHTYDAMHVSSDGEHQLALAFLASTLNYLNIRSILDIGSGTGRVVSYMKKICPEVKVIGIEPVAALREIGYANGISKDELIDGDAISLDFAASQFDLVCEFGVLHHLREPSRAVSEMLRVADKAVFISDSNNFGQGSFASRFAKQCLNRARLWPFANFIKTKGQGYSVTDGDGISYSYSVFNDYKKIKKECRSVHLLNTKDGDVNPYSTASHIALLGIKN